MKPYQLEVFFDGECPLCRREIQWLRKRDAECRVRFTDISAADFDPAVTGKTVDQLMAHIHGRTADGAWLEGVGLFIQLYHLTRLGWLSRIMSSWLLRPLFEVGYRFFAKHRLSLTGRPRCTSNCAIDGATPS